MMVSFKSEEKETWIHIVEKAFALEHFLLLVVLCCVPNIKVTVIKWVQQFTIELAVSFGKELSLA